MAKALTAFTKLTVCVVPPAKEVRTLGHTTVDEPGRRACHSAPKPEELGRTHNQVFGVDVRGVTEQAAPACEAIAQVWRSPAAM